MYKLTTSKRCVTTITDCSVTAWMVGFRAGSIGLWNAGVYWLPPSCASILDQNHHHPAPNPLYPAPNSPLSCTYLDSFITLQWDVIENLGSISVLNATSTSEKKHWWSITWASHGLIVQQAGCTTWRSYLCLIRVQLCPGACDILLVSAHLYHFIKLCTNDK